MTKRYFIVAVIALTVLMASGFLLMAQNTLPPDKLVIEQQYVQERDQGTRNPAPRNPNASPSDIDVPEIPFQTNIITDCEPLYSPQDVDVGSCWQGLANGATTFVYAGAEAQSYDPEQGVVVVATVSDYPGEVNIQRVLSPMRAGGLSITAAQGTLLTMKSEKGPYILVFDAVTRIFTSVVLCSPPAVSCPSNMTVEFLNELGAPVSFDPLVIDACSDATIVCTPASGSVFPIGNTLVSCIATNAAGSANSCSFTVTVLGSLGSKQDVLSELTSLLRGVNEQQIAALLNEAINHLSNALDNNLWIDQTHLQPKGGQKIFNEEKNAVNQLRVIMQQKDNSIPAAVLKSVIDRIVKSDRLLAVVEIQAAQASGAGAARIDEDNKELTKGDTDIAEGKYESGIEHYRNAWMHALHLKVLSFNPMPDGNVRLEFIAFSGEGYTVQASTNMTDWITIGTGTAPADGVVVFNDLGESRTISRFYRAGRVP